MAPDNHRRGFSISHQKVVLEVDFSGGLWGYTELTIVPTHKDLKTIHVHSRQCTIHSVTVASLQADFVQYDPFVNLNISNPQDCHSHPELKRRVYSAFAEGDEGELSISIPPSVSLKQSAGGRADSAGATPELQAAASSQSTEFAPITVHIEYSLRNPADGIQFVLPTDAYPYRVPHAYTTPSSPDAARCWVPCVDSVWEKCTWEFEFVVPRYLEERDNDDGDEGEDTQGTYPSVVVCSGELVEQVAHPYNSSKTIFLFSQPIVTSVQHIAWAAGPFHVFPIPSEHYLAEEASGSQPLMHAFCLPGHEAHLAASVGFVRSAMNFYLSELGSYPFGSHKLVFVDELPTQRFDSATLSLVHVDLLHGEDAIDQVYETRLALSHALACQWVGLNIQPRTYSDTWLINGLGLYISGLFLRKLMGLNEYRYRLKKDMERVLEWDNGAMPPICQPQNSDPPDGALLPFVNLKAPLVLHILDRRLCKSGTSLGLSRVLPKVFLSAISGELVNNALSTHAFLRICRKVSGMDPRSFAEQWIYGSGCPAFGFNASFNRKKMAVEILMRQESPAYKQHEHNELTKALFKPVPFFEGQMTIRIHEADGTPYEHVLDIRSPFKRFEVPFNTKYKRVRRNTKRYLARQAAAQAAVEGEGGDRDGGGGAGGAGAPGDLVDVGFGVEIWNSDQERENWKIAEWTEEDEQQMSGATYEWIRMDADFDWIAAVAFDQPDFMWVSQLQRDRDVVAQLEAVYALTKQPTNILSSVLTKTVLVNKYFYRIRCEAALALAKCAIPRLDYLGLFHLFKLFLRYCYDPEDPHQDLFTHTYVPRSNDFSDLPEYFVRKALVNALSRVRFDTGKTPAIIRQFLMDQLRFNDNTSNPYSDAFYICTIISALACATVPSKPPERNELLTTEIRIEQNTEDVRLLQQAIAEVDRYRSMDRLIPSYHNVVTVAAVEFHLVLAMADLIPNDPRIFFPLTREGNYTQVRMAAFDALFLTKWYTPKIMRYFLAVMAHDSSRVIRRHVARNACQSLALLVSMGELKASAKEAEALLIEEDGNLPEKVKEAKKSDVEMMIKALRKDREVGKNEVIREFLMPIALAPDVDHEVRWCLLKLADLLVRGSEEAPPKVTIHLPPTPVSEVPPALPPVKVQLKAPRPPKAGTPARSPVTTFALPPKLKLVQSSVPPTPSIRTPSTPVLESGKRGVSFAGSKSKKPAAAQAHAQVPKSPKAVPKAQSGGMSLSDLRASRNALKKLQTSKHAVLFQQPVDPVRDKAPNYFEVIKNPMDLSTMHAKLEAGLYKDKDAFEVDFRLMVDNCKLYNADGTYAYNEAVSLQVFFDKQWDRIKKTLEKVAQAQSATTPGSAAVVFKVPLPPVHERIETPPSRPVIKLKVGGKAGEAPPVAESSKPVPKLKPPKQPKPKAAPAAVDLPPPPYIDDGSHDLLQEVIAIEAEKSVPKASRPTPTVKLSIGKRKKADSAESEDDDILALVTPPAKKEKPSPPSASTSPAAPAPPAPRPKLVIAPAQQKAKKAEPAPVAPVAPVAAPAPPPAPRITLKGKEKERTSTPQPSSGPAKKTTAIPVNEKKCKDVIKALLKLPAAAIFARPVDTELDGCPTYYDEIKEPMDFGTMQKKLGEGKYATMQEFASDVALIIDNCRKFNPVGTDPILCAEYVEKAFEKEWVKATERKLTYTEKRSLSAVLAKVTADPISWAFLEPVDPVALQIPTYFNIIPRKDARDLRTIKQKLDADKYDSVEAFEADYEMMVRNAITFNGAESEVGLMAIAVRKKMREVMGNANVQGLKKRKETGSEKGTPQPASKKVKLK